MAEIINSLVTHSFNKSAPAAENVESSLGAFAALLHHNYSQSPYAELATLLHAEGGLLKIIDHGPAAVAGIHKTQSHNLKTSVPASEGTSSLEHSTATKNKTNAQAEQDKPEEKKVLKGQDYAENNAGLVLALNLNYRDSLNDQSASYSQNDSHNNPEGLGHEFTPTDSLQDVLNVIPNNYQPQASEQPNNNWWQRLQQDLAEAAIIEPLTPAANELNNSNPSAQPGTSNTSGALVTKSNSAAKIDLTPSESSLIALNEIMSEMPQVSNSLHDDKQKLPGVTKSELPTQLPAATTVPPAPQASTQHQHHQQSERQPSTPAPDLSANPPAAPVEVQFGLQTPSIPGVQVNAAETTASSSNKTGPDLNAPVTGAPASATGAGNSFAKSITDNKILKETQTNNLSSKFQEKVDLIKKIQVGIAQAKDQDSIKISLKPEHLAEIHIRLSTDKENRAKAEIIAGDQATIALLRNETKNIIQALEQAGLHASADDLSFHYQENGNNSGTEHDSPQHTPWSTEETPVVKTLAPARASTSDNNRYLMQRSTTNILA